VRNGLEFEGAIESDCASVSGIVMDLLGAGVEVHCMRDLTRGGLASALVEIAEAAKVHISLKESAIPVDESVRGACELLGLDPVHIANEGRFTAFVPPEDAERALDIIRSHANGARACQVGRVTAANDGLVTMQSLIGVERIVDMLSGEQLPRIC
jgi:hydrogenase expression/formation protein HypE